MHTEPAADPEAVALLRDAARDALALGDAAGAAALLSRALDEPPARRRPRRRAARARPGAAPAPAHRRRSNRCRRSSSAARTPTAIAAAAIELSGMLFFAGRAAEGAAILRRAQERLPAGEPAREQLEVALLGLSSTSASARREAEATIAALRDPGGPARDVLQATTLATLAMDEVLYLRSASTAIDLARARDRGGPPGRAPPRRELGEPGPGRPRRSRTVSTPPCGAPTRSSRGRAQRGAALTVVTISALRALIALRRGDLAAAQADAQAAIELAPDLLGARFLVLAVSAAVLAGLERDETPDSLRRLIDRTGVRYDAEFTSSSQLRYASGVLRAAAGNHEAAIEELRGCALDHPAFGGENPAMLPWRSAAALSLAELGRHGEARSPGRRRGAPRAVVRRAARDRHRAARPGARRPPRGTVEGARGGARGAGALAGAAGARARAGRPRRHVPRRRAAHRGPRAAARRARAGRPLRRPSPGAPGAGRARGDRRPAPDHRARRGGLADAQRAARGRARRGGRHEPRDRPDAVRHREDGRDAPRTGVPSSRWWSPPAPPLALRVATDRSRHACTRPAAASTGPSTARSTTAA